MSTSYALRSRRVITPQGEIAATVIIKNGKIVGIESYDYPDLPSSQANGVPLDGDCVDIHDVVLPGLVDTHVHINEPGRTDWEGFDTATHAAAAGGITSLVDMPLNCIPVTTSAAALQAKLEHIDKKLWVDCGYWGGATADNLADLPGLLQSGVLGVKSFTIHSGIDEFQAVNQAQLLAAMREVAEMGLVHLIHAELEHPVDLGQDIGRSYGRFLASRPTSWENNAIAMVIRVMRALRAEGLEPRAHIVHLSSGEALPQIAAARAEGLHLTCETCPHYLTLYAEAIPDGATLYKCCPPIRENHNRDLLWQGLKDGVIDCIVSDHSPCTPNLKALDTGDIGSAWGGISALQFGLSLVWTEGQQRGFNLSTLAHLMATRPAQIAGLSDHKGQIAIGYDADFCLLDDQAHYTITADIIKHKHKISPYIGKTVQGLVNQTWLRGKVIYAHNHYYGEASGHSLFHSLTAKPG